MTAGRLLLALAAVPVPVPAQSAATVLKIDGLRNGAAPLGVIPGETWQESAFVLG
jgi:hypothetical protein